MKRFRITLPATIDGLGAGTGILGLALALHDTVEVEIGEEPGEITGEESICRAYETWQAEALPSARFTLQRCIPERYGLGEKTARIVAGLAAVVAATEAKDARRQVFRLALGEGAAPAQLAACVMGGVTTALHEGDEILGLHVADHLSMEIALFLPDDPLDVALPAADPARLSYFLTALMWGRWDWLGPAMRPDSMPATLDPVLGAARETGAYASGLTSGALFALTPFGQGEAVAAAMEERGRAAGLGGRGLATEVSETGVQVKRIDPE